MAAAEDQYFYEDEVYRINKRGHIEFGMVLENSELVSSDENSDREDGGKMKKGHIRVAWHPSGVEEVISEKKVGLADRSLMPGDVVRRMIKGKDTQRGYCRDIRVIASVQVVGTKQVIPNVKSEDLVPLEEFAADIAVCLDSWVGGIKMVHSKLHLYLPDAGPGSRCVINELEANGLEEFDEKKDADSEFPHRNDYYPGQVLYGPLHCLEYANWTQCTKDMKAQRSKPNRIVQVVVEGVETTSVGVHWQCRAYSKDGAGNDKEQPRFLVTGDDLKRLKLLNVFEPCTLQVGDRNYYTYREEDSVISKEQWRRSQRDVFRPNCRERGGEHHHRHHHHHHHHQHHGQRHFHKLSTINGSTSKSQSPSGENVPHLVKSGSQPPRTNQEMDIMACQGGKGSEVPVLRSKETLLDQGRKKRMIGDGKMNHNRQKLSEAPPSKSSSPSLKRTTAGEPRVGDTSMHTTDANATEGNPPPEEHGWTVLRGLRKNVVRPVEDGDFDDADSTSEDMSISSGCSSTGSQGMKKRGPALMTKVLKKKKLRRAKKRPPQVSLEPGTKVVVETLSTSSVADVIWQDGSVEKNIPSTQLYPIHHLDDQEFFPGDFVMENKDENSCMRIIYGVIQSVDHAGRTARVKWFKTYTSVEEPQPTLLEENEVSVYDLKDHPDFQYRPGTVVIRVANFEGEDASCTAGQILDNYPEGRVRVWWVDGHISMCWPQDLYKVGEYDSEEGELWDDGSSEASWETESVDSFVADEGVEESLVAANDALKPKLAANIEKARIAMSRLEEIFTQNPALQNTEVMRKLLEVYRDCRYLDKLMGTSFFHESHFEGLLDKVRERGRINVAQRVADQVSRLFHPSNALPCVPAPRPALSDPDADIFPELRVAMQMAEQLNELVQSQCRASQAANQKNSFMEKICEQQGSMKKLSNHIVQLFQKTLFSRFSNQEKDQCLNESCEGTSPVCTGTSKSGGKVLGEIRFCHQDLGDSDLNRNCTLRLRFLQSDDSSASTQSTDTAPSPPHNPISSPPVQVFTVDIKSPSDEESGENGFNVEMSELQGDLKSVSRKVGKGEGSIDRTSSLVSGEYLAESLANLERRLAAAAANATAYSSYRKVTRKLMALLGRFSSLKCEMLMGDEVFYTMDLGSRSSSQAGELSSATHSSASTSAALFPTRDDLKADSALSEVLSESGEVAVPTSITNTAESGPETESAICVRLCSLIKAQLVKAHGEVIHRFGGQLQVMSLSDAANSVSPNSNKDEGGDALLCQCQEGDVDAGKGDPHAVPKVDTSVGTHEHVDVDSGLGDSKMETTDTFEREPAELETSNVDGGFTIEDSAPDSHKFKLTVFQPSDPPNLYRAVRREIKLLRTSLPDGIWVKGFEDRMDLYSVMIRGPEKTPYEDGLFMFDFQLPDNYPDEPPLCHYISYCSDRLNPNLYEDGKVCVSLLGTWSGKGTEVWTSSSNLLQVIVSIQGLILVSEPYFNEAGYEKQKGSQQGRENSRMYNEMVILKLVQAMSKLVQHPPPVFQEEIRQHFQQHALRFAARLDKWLDISDHYNSTHPLSPTTPTSFGATAGEGLLLPEFPLIPASKGFCLTLHKTLAMFREVMASLGITGDCSVQLSNSLECSSNS